MVHSATTPTSRQHLKTSTTRKTIYYNICSHFFVSANNYNRYKKNDLLFWVSVAYTSRYYQKYFGARATPAKNIFARPPVLVHSIQNLSLHSSSFAALRCSGTRMEERHHFGDRSAVRQLLHSPLLPHRQQRSSLLLQHRQWQREARRRTSEQTMALPSSSPSAVASGGAAARRSSLLPQRHRQRRSSLLAQQGAPSSSVLYSVAASSLL
jgi:hypothetical protein